MRQLSGQDASFLFLESGHAHLHLAALYIFDSSTVEHGSLDYEGIVAYVESRLHTSHVFRQKLVSLPLSVDYPYWVDDVDFDIRNHMHHCSLPEPADWQALCGLVSEIHSRPLDLDRPLWEMHVVEGLDSIPDVPEGAFALVVRYHHAAIDGVTGTEILSGLLDTSPDHDPQPEPVPWRAEQQPGLLGMLTRAAAHTIAAPFELAKAATVSLPDLAAMLAEAGDDVEHRDAVPNTRFNSPVSPHRVFDAVSFDLAELAAMRRAVDGATVNDVVLAICGGALREYLAGWDELPGESLVAMAPINARIPGEEELTGNVLATMFVPVHTDIEDPVARLRAIHAATARAKKPARNAGARRMTEIVRHIPAQTQAIACRMVTALGLGYRSSPLCNCTITNIPGPREPLYLNGARLVLSTGAGPVIDGMGLLVAVFSYAGSIVFSFTGCRDITPDPEKLCACTRNAFADLRAATQEAEVTSTGS